jgi:hypothetical protein
MSGPEHRQVLITTIPFGEVDPRPLELLAAGVAYAINPLGRCLKEIYLEEYQRRYGLD